MYGLIGPKQSLWQQFQQQFFFISPFKIFTNNFGRVWSPFRVFWGEKIQFCFLIKCNTEKKTLVNKWCNILNTYSITVLLSRPLNKLPWLNLWGIDFVRFNLWLMTWWHHLICPKDPLYSKILIEVKIFASPTNFDLNSVDWKFTRCVTSQYMTWIAICSHFSFAAL